MPGRRQHMQIVDAFGVEAMGRRRGGQADCHGFAGSKVETAKPDVRVGLLTAVDPGPHLDQVASRDPGVELATAQG
ncbi:hypothetical protein TUM20985_19710 [Mycobacterium antarcticum]|nr:hypothetical protein TUM20985_19710 [Mycolicibacterium sp. TUM20985]GLP74776.1 hypothetical protein TUM20983_18860 [Mycolicibacterium sp. TUM20983]GLP80571.1 hypothetical protein TUM20984_19910 [Mycolicibacterium sp. TUM20984]